MSSLCTGGVDLQKYLDAEHKSLNRRISIAPPSGVDFEGAWFGTDEVDGQTITIPIETEPLNKLGGVPQDNLCNWNYSDAKDDPLMIMQFDIPVQVKDCFGNIQWISPFWNPDSPIKKNAKVFLEKQIQYTDCDTGEFVSGEWVMERVGYLEEFQTIDNGCKIRVTTADPLKLYKNCFLTEDVNFVVPDEGRPFSEYVQFVVGAYLGEDSVYAANFCMSDEAMAQLDSIQVTLDEADKFSFPVTVSLYEILTTVLAYVGCELRTIKNPDNNCFPEICVYCPPRENPVEELPCDLVVNQCHISSASGISCNVNEIFNRVFIGYMGLNDFDQEAFIEVAKKEDPLLQIELGGYELDQNGNPTSTPAKAGIKPIFLIVEEDSPLAIPEIAESLVCLILQDLSRTKFEGQLTFNQPVCLDTGCVICIEDVRYFKNKQNFFVTDVQQNPKSTTVTYKSSYAGLPRSTYVLLN